MKQEEILQAVVIADSFNVKFGPVTQKTPRALLPLVNVPMLDYTLDYLASQGVQETFIFCSHRSADIRQHIGQSSYGEDSTMSVKIILAAGSRSLGDALKEIHARSLIRNDFFLLTCDTIANVNLKALMEEHRERRTKIKSAVMTMTCMKLKPEDRMRCAEDNIFLAVEPGTKQICDYQRVTLDKKIKIPMKHCDMDFHQDLLDGQLYICSPTVLFLFTDNFDYCTLDDFIRGVIINEEIFGNTVHVNILKKGYCARITNPYMYNIISQDIISRRTKPVTPEQILLSGRDVVESFGMERNIYLGPDVTLASSVELKQNVVVGKGTTIQAGTEIRDSVIGPNCTIGADVTMQNCYLWGSVKIEDGCRLEHAILCDGVTVFANSTVKPQTVLSWNVKVGPDIELPPGIRLQDTPEVDEFAEEDEGPIPEVTPEYGRKSLAFLYTPDSEDVDSDDDNDKFNTDWGEPLIVPHSSDDDVGSVNASDMDEESDEDVDEYGSFCSELTATLTRAKEENIKLDNLILEVNSLKHAYNIAIKEVHQAVVKVLAEIPLMLHESLQGKELMTAVLRHVDSHRGLLQHYIKNKEAQLDCLHALEDFAVENERMLGVLSKVVQYLYNKDILEEQVIIKWYDTEAEEDEEEEHAKIRKQMEAFVTWMKEADEEESDD